MSLFKPSSDLACKLSSLLILEQQSKSISNLHIFLSFLVIWNWNDEYVHTLPQFPRNVPDRQSLYPFSDQNDPKTPRGWGGGTPDFKWQGWSKDFLGFEIFDSGIFLRSKIWQVFFCVAWFKWAFVLTIQNNLKIPDSAHKSPKSRKPPPSSAIKNQQANLFSFLEIFKAQKFSMGYFWGLIFGPGSFCGFCWKL